MIHYFCCPNNTILNNTMSKSSQDALSPSSIFSNMFSILNSHPGNWPSSFTLPDPQEIPHTLKETLPNIFPNEPHKKVKAVTACPHSARKHYAKNMCNNCYHRLGRDKSAWLCEHSDRKHYAKGLCQFCYFKHYNQARQDL
ncbi:hypothetical protein SteCoe_28386 [Stentor coeruleus]|uniref:Uncharacterized protein n=1 Tax=Stentor coeruleus TaxID=5963 RepID=A0A1R2B8C3_9CILI|nr:hypothetical protein SteCoe_28386 [Stentor coeruleus]